MAESPAKRRKLSPEPQDALSTPNTPNQVPTSVGGALQSSISRPSFASPTKASQARHNPQFLERSSAAVAANLIVSSNENEVLAAPTEIPIAKPSGIQQAGAEDQESQESRVDLEERSREAGLVASQVEPTPSGRTTRSAGSNLTAPPRRKSRTPGRELPRAPGTVAAGQTAQSIPSGRAITPVPFRTAGLRRSLVAAQEVKPQDATRIREAEVPEEPELPPTPTQRGLADPVVTTPPSGIHNTPSKRSRRLRGAKAKSSPLKPRPEVTSQTRPPAVAPATERPELSDLAIRHIIPIDPHADKKKVRDQILQELQQLQADVALAEQETERHRRHFTSGKGPAEARNPDDIIALLGRSIANSTPKAQLQKPSSIFQSITSFLPFSRRPRARVKDPPKDITLPSHLPTALEDQLPYLQVFTPLKLDSTVTLLPSKPAPENSTSTSTTILQNHDVTMTAPSGLFSARLNFTVDTVRLTISSLAVTSLEPSAEAELGRWVRERASGGGILGRDLNAICWAMSRWYELATKRAGFWCEVEREFGNKNARRRSTARLKAAVGNKRKRRRGAVVVEEEEETAGTAEGPDDEGSPPGKKWTRKELLAQMNRIALVLNGEGVQLRIEWFITFDWTGEAESNISAKAQVPSTWREADERGSLAKVPETFDQLVKARGAMAAVRAMVALLMPS